MKYKLGLDLGSTSLGWAVLELDEQDNIIGLRDIGVRIFPDGRDEQKHTPINVERRNARTMRRRGDRVKIRKKRTLQLIKKYGLDFDISKNPELQDPYKLRADALTKKLTNPELGRVMFHLALRRGFKSNRKETRGEEGGKLKNATKTLQSALGTGTLAQFQVANKRYRFANQFEGNVIKEGAMYPTRDMYVDEFNKICDAQELPQQMRQEFDRAIFRQSPLKPVVVGKCLFEKDEYRAYKFEPAYQKSRTLQQINQLMIVENGISKPLTPEQRKKLEELCFSDFSAINSKGKLTFAEIKKQLHKAKMILSKTDCRFNLERENRDSIDIDKTAYEFYKIGEFDFWKSLQPEQQSDILHKINDNHIEDDDLIDYLTEEYNLTEKQADKIISINLEDDVGNVSLKVINKIIPFLEKGQMYHLAMTNAGYEHSAQAIDSLDKLPYYGELSALQPSLAEDRDGKYRTMNATVHIAMNQIRAVVNDLIANPNYGKPYAINIEMGRDVRSGAKDLSDLLKTQAKNKKTNDRIREEFIEPYKQRANKENILRVKLWEELGTNVLDRRCPYTGEIISIEKLFSPEFEIEHILPFAQTLDDSVSNKTLSKREANRFKGNRTPYDAFTADDSPYNYEGIWQRVKNLPDSKKWRFAKGALERYNKEGGCIARALNDTRHMSRMATTYLKHVCINPTKVIGLPGGMTALFRDMWKLNWWKDKEYEDTYRASHIHHAVDAFVIACMNEGQLKTLVTNASRQNTQWGPTQKEKRKQWFQGVEIPFVGFDYVVFKEMCENTIISYRKSIKKATASGTVGQLHEDTAYNLEEFTNGIVATMSRRESLPTTDKDKEKFAKKGWQNVNQTIWQTFMKDTGYNNDTPNIGMRFLEWCQSQKPQIKKVRINKTGVDTSTYIPIFRTKAERDECMRAYIDWYIQKDIYDGIQNKKEKQAQKDKEAELLAIYRDRAKRAYKWYVSGNNFCAEIYAIRDDDKRYPKLRGKWQADIVSNYNAELLGGTAPLWRRKHPTARRVMSLRINDMVMAEFSKNDPKLPRGLVDAVNHQCAIEKKDTVQMVFRVKKINSSGTVYLRPHYIAKEEADQKSWMASVGSLQEHKACKIRVSPTGKILEQL